MVTKNIEFQNSENLTLRGVLNYPDSIEPQKFPAVIIVHGFNEMMTGGWLVDIANTIYPRGYVTLRFDFHGHGESEGDFKDHTITKQISDLISAVSFLENLDMVNISKIAVIGHDIGGDIAVLSAEKDSRIKAVVMWASRGNLKRYTESKMADYEIKELKTKGIYSHGNFDIKNSYLESINKHNVSSALQTLEIPLLVIHGLADLQVRADEARMIYSFAKQPKQLELIDEADHWFRHKRAKNELHSIVIDWLNKWLK